MTTTTCAHCHRPAAPGDDRCSACGGPLDSAWGAPVTTNESGEPQPSQQSWGQAPPPGAPPGSPQHGPWGSQGHWQGHAPPQGAWQGHPQGNWQGQGHPQGQWHGQGHPQGQWHGPPQGQPPWNAMTPYQGGPPMPPRNEWPIPRGAVIALGIVGDLIITLILWAVWRERYPLAAQTILKTFGIKVGVTFGAVFLFMLLAAL